MTVLLLFALIGSASAAGWQWLAPQRVHDLQREGSGLWLVDLRNAQSFAAAHPEGAVQILAEELTMKHLPHRKIIVLVDDSLGQRQARQSADRLAGAGYERVYVLEGGLAGWQAEGLPVAGNTPFTFRQDVNDDDIAWARRHGVPVVVYDLRDAVERERGGFPDAHPVTGTNFTARLAQLPILLKSPAAGGLAARLKQPAPVVLILPDRTADRALAERTVRNVPGDIRFLAGWAVPTSAAVTQPTVIGACPTCPGAVVKGETK